MDRNAPRQTLQYLMEARARVVRSGKTLKICMADVFVKKGAAENHCATVLATIMCRAGKADRPR